MSNDDIHKIRQRIDEIDASLLALLNERIVNAKKIGEIKSILADTRIYRPEREAQILRKLVELNTGPLANVALERLFREIMSVSRGAEQALCIGVLGPEGTYSQSAALKHFGHDVDIAYSATIDDVFRLVETGNADYGVVPVENSTEGGVSLTLHRFIDTSLNVCAEVSLPIHHCLLGSATDIGAIKQVLAHSQALAQCRRWRDANLSGVETLAVASNAEAARQAADDPHTAAIAGETNAEHYGLNILANNIEDEAGNTTRFLVIAKDHVPAPSGNDKTSVVFSVKHQPGALHHALKPLARHAIDMSRLESRPSRLGNWDYVFFVDLLGHAEDTGVATALAEMEKETAFLKRLGSYPKAL